MLNRAPYNTEVPQFLPSRDAPINSYITRKYPCQEHLAGETNKFGTLTWKIQQPDPSMVWQSVKVVLPMEICGYHKSKDQYTIAAKNNMSVIVANPSCNIALSQSPMNAFRQTSLTLNGRIFSEDNYYRDILDACYRGVGTQAYGDNHSLKPIVNRGIHSDDTSRAPVQFYIPEDGANPAGWASLRDDDGNYAYARTEDYAKQTVPSVNTLLEHNGPFIERARIFQDNLSYDGKTWVGEISHLLELGPFQARARKGNTAVPYVQDFHLRLNFANVPSKFDVNNKTLRTSNPTMIEALEGRVMAPKLLEFATYANFLHKDEVIRSYLGWPAGFTFKYTAQPYLEVTYTKHEAGMRDSYNLRCFEHVYETSNRFQLTAPEDSFTMPHQLARVTSRLLSNPTKIYVWGEVSDEFKYTYGMGGVRRSCRLENLHLRVNQRPDVMFNPSQEECYEMFRRHTNSNLEYGSWRKSPIYVFNMVDVGQPDMYANDARITWFEWDAEVSLTELQITEQNNLKAVDKLEAIGYNVEKDENGDFQTLKDMSHPTKSLMCTLDHHWRKTISDSDDRVFLSFIHHMDGSLARSTIKADAGKVNQQLLRVEEQSVQSVTGSDVKLGDVANASVSLRGCIWAQVYIDDSGNHAKGDIVGNELFYIPESFRFDLTTGSASIVNSTHSLTFAAKIHFTNTDMSLVHFVKGRLVDTYAQAGQGKMVGTNEAGNATWAPGFAGYSITGSGINNSVVLEYKDLPLCAEGTGNKTLWVAFAPETNMPSDSQGHNNWMQWTNSKTMQQIQQEGGLDNWKTQLDHTATQWGLGQEVLHAEYPCQWGYKDRESFWNVPVIPENEGFGAQMVYMETLAATDKSEDYQLKVLYEYGNCQYNFSRNATPTRVLPNVVPVGPSPGIPAPL